MVCEESNIFVTCVFLDMAFSYGFSLEPDEFGNDLLSRLLPVITSITYGGGGAGAALREPPVGFGAGGVAIAPCGENSAACTMAFGSFFLVSMVLRSASWILPSVAPMVSCVASSGVTSSVMTATVCGLPSRSCSTFCPAAGA